MRTWAKPSRRDALDCTDRCPRSRILVHWCPRSRSRSLANGRTCSVPSFRSWCSQIQNSRWRKLVLVSRPRYIYLLVSVAWEPASGSRSEIPFLVLASRTKAYPPCSTLGTPDWLQEKLPLTKLNGSVMSVKEVRYGCRF